MRADSPARGRISGERLGRKLRDGDLVGGIGGNRPPGKTCAEGNGIRGCVPFQGRDFHGQMRSHSRGRNHRPARFLPLAAHGGAERDRSLFRRGSLGIIREATTAAPAIFGGPAAAGVPGAGEFRQHGGLRGRHGVRRGERDPQAEPQVPRGEKESAPLFHAGTPRFRKRPRGASRPRCRCRSPRRWRGTRGNGSSPWRRWRGTQRPAWRG